MSFINNLLTVLSMPVLVILGYRLRLYKVLMESIVMLGLFKFSKSILKSIQINITFWFVLVNMSSIHSLKVFILDPGILYMHCTCQSYRSCMNMRNVSSCNLMCSGRKGTVLQGHVESLLSMWKISKVAYKKNYCAVRFLLLFYCHL